jgi:hypothetical protein
MAPICSSLISSGSKKKEPRYACLNEAKASHSHKMWTEVSFSVPHFLQMGSLRNPIICKCLLKVLCPVSRPITTLDCVLLKDNSQAPIVRSGPKINSQACSGSYNSMIVAGANATIIVTVVKLVVVVAIVAAEVM